MGGNDRNLPLTKDHGEFVTVSISAEEYNIPKYYQGKLFLVCVENMFGICSSGEFGIYGEDRKGPQTKTWPRLNIKCHNAKVRRIITSNLDLINAATFLPRGKVNRNSYFRQNVQL